MLPGVVAADWSDGYSVRFICRQYEYQYAQLYMEDWPPDVRAVLDDPLVEYYRVLTEGFTGKPCVVAGIDTAHAHDQ